MSKPFDRFVEIVAALRNPEGGCPWDLEQTHQTLRPYLIEEAYEVLEAIDSGDDKELCAELGDLLLQVVLHAQLASERKAFDISAVAEGVADKMVRRHPHVFGDVNVKGSAEVLKNWEMIKTEERAAKGPDKPPSVLDGIPAALPALLRAQRVGEKASRVGFDWPDTNGVWEKVREEIAELEAAMSGLKETITQALTTAPKGRDPKLQKDLEGELGDVLFSLCQLGRWLGVSAEDSLRGTIQKFFTRFHYIERSADKPLKEMSLEELDRLWEKSKNASS